MSTESDPDTPRAPLSPTPFSERERMLFDQVATMSVMTAELHATVAKQNMQIMEMQQREIELQDQYTKIYGEWKALLRCDYYEKCVWCNSSVFCMFLCRKNEHTKKMTY
jgi:hypothetical protein